MSEIAERGEPSAGLHFERLYRDDFVRAVRLAHLLTGSNDAGEDIAQEAFLRVRTVRAQISDPQAYLTTTVVRMCRITDTNPGPATFNRPTHTHNSVIPTRNELPPTRLPAKSHALCSEQPTA